MIEDPSAFFVPSCFFVTTFDALPFRASSQYTESETEIKPTEPTEHNTHSTALIWRLLRFQSLQISSHSLVHVGR